MSNWQPGDLAIIADKIHAASSPELYQYQGATVTLQSHGEKDWWFVAADGFCFQAKEKVLRKPYDPLEPGSWEDMKDIWTPKELEILV